MERIIDYFFEEDEKELVPHYKILLTVCVISTFISILGVIW